MGQGPIVWPLLKWAIWSDKWAFKIRNKDQIWLQTCTTWETCVPLRSCVIRIACLKFSTPNLKFQFCDQIREANSKKATLRVEIKEEMLNFFFLFFFNFIMYMSDAAKLEPFLLFGVFENSKDRPIWAKKHTNYKTCKDSCKCVNNCNSGFMVQTTGLQPPWNMMTPPAGFVTLLKFLNL